jgi:hypothetical protein
MTKRGVANTSEPKAANGIVAIARRHIHHLLIRHLVTTKASILVIDVPVSVEWIGIVVNDNIIVIIIVDAIVTLAAAMIDGID